MKQKKTNPAVTKAIDSVRTRLEAGEWPAGSRMPSAPKLAAGAQVSKASMIRALPAMRAMGLITTIERGGIRAGGTPAATRMPVSEEANLLWRLKRVSLEQDILNGAFSEDDCLPTLKELTAKYGVHYATMRKILFSMIDDGVLHLRDRRFMMSDGHSRQTSRRIVFLTHNFQGIPLTALNQTQYRIFDLLEYECTRRGIQLKIMEINSFTLTGKTGLLHGEAQEGIDTSFIVDVWWDAASQFHNLMGNLLVQLDHSKKPVAILDENGGFVLPLAFIANPLFQVFSIESRKAGGRVARLLLAMGHRSVAYLSSLHDTQWSQERLEGIQEQYAKAGCAKGVKPVIRAKVELTRDQVLALSNFSERLIRRLLSKDTEGNQDESYRRFMEFKAAFSTGQFDSEDIRAIRDRLAIIKELDKKESDPEAFDQGAVTVFWQIFDHVYPKIVAPLFRESLMHTDATAWICANDGIAAQALSFLKEAGVNVPSQISIVGFNNQPIKALEQRLTTVDFNALGFVYRMLNFIARPPKPRGPYRHKSIEIEAVIMKRDTAAPPRRDGRVAG